MTRFVSIQETLCFLLVQIIVINATTGETSVQHDNSTIPTSEMNSGRSRRSLDEMFPNVLRIRVKYETGIEVDLTWVKKINHLANQHLPVYSSLRLLDQSAMKYVGEFILYHDMERCSSVAFFARTRTFIGHIGVNYIIDELPYKFDTSGNYPHLVGLPYVRKSIDVPDTVQPIVILPPPALPSIEDSTNNPSNHNPDTSLKRPLDSNPGPSTKLQRTKRDFDAENYGEETHKNLTKSNIRIRRWSPLMRDYYLEILVFISPEIHQIFAQFYTQELITACIVKYCIRYFNAVDTMFQKIHKNGVKMHINIAKVVILDNLELLDVTSEGDISFIGTVGKLRKYLSDNRVDYTPDSFDHVFMITSRRIMFNSVRAPGKTAYRSSLYAARDEGNFYDAIPITAVEYGSRYIQAVYEIGQTLNIRKERSIEEMETTGQCDSIMQTGSSRCDRCLRWSDNSKIQFVEFFRNNHNRCFLLNEPRSLRPSGPSVFITPNAQCNCFGYRSYTRISGQYVSNLLRADECNVALQCQKFVGNNQNIGYILPPFDGTYCSTTKQVCWNGECVFLSKRQRCA